MGGERGVNARIVDRFEHPGDELVLVEPSGGK
jgi:hypothetical protein